MSRTLTALLSGTLFGVGLAVAQMTNPAKVLAFLDFAGAWDPSLAFVMGTALLVSALAYRIARQPSPNPLAAEIDGRLLLGASFFGLGWGLAGFCPGPALASLVSGSLQVALFVVSMLAGMGLYHFVIEPRPDAESRAGSEHAA